ncbi:MAG: hypothetical protein FWE45_03275 [Firmicutes bacterium]|nr:hypothetical protein [Bacillota bacterium]
MLRINKDDNLPMSQSKVVENGTGMIDKGGGDVGVLEQNSAPHVSHVVDSPPTVVNHIAPAVAPPNSRPSLLKRIRKIKHIEIYAAVVVILIMVGIYASNFMGGSGAANDPLRIAKENFAREKEAKLVATLSQVQGAGRISAMVTVVGSETREIAYNVEERTVTQTGPNGQTNTTTTLVRTPIIVNGQPLVLVTIKPQVRGVVIVAQGANDLIVRLNLIRAIQALIPDNTVSIEILAGR